MVAKMTLYEIKKIDVMPVCIRKDEASKNTQRERAIQGIGEVLSDTN